MPQSGGHDSGIAPVLWNFAASDPKAGPVAARLALDADASGAGERNGEDGVESSMPTIQQLIRNPRQPKVKRSKSMHLQSCPQKRGVCTRVYTTTPKKPNSALFVFNFQTPPGVQQYRVCDHRRRTTIPL